MTTVQDDRGRCDTRSAQHVPARQLPLPLVWSDRAAEGGFLIGASNEDAVRYVLAPEAWTIPVTLLTGPEGAGKSHLGRLFAARTNGVVVEYAEMDEEAVFHAWNRALSNNHPMLVISRDDAMVDKVSLPDLRTRLSSTPHLTIAMPDVMLATALLERMLAERGLAVTGKLASFVAQRIERSYAALHRATAAIDAAAMGSGRVLGERLVRDALIAAGLIGMDDAPQTME